MNIGVTSRDLAIAFPPSGSSLLPNKLSVVSVVFTCIWVQGNRMKSWPLWRRAITAKSTNHYHYLQAFSDRFAAFRTKLIISQVEVDQVCVRLP